MKDRRKMTLIFIMENATYEFWMPVFNVAWTLKS